MSESLKKVTLFCKLGSEKVLKDNVLLKEIPRALVFTSNFVFQKLVRREHLKIFLGVSLAVVVVVVFFLFFWFLFFFFFLFLFHVESRLSPV